MEYQNIGNLTGNLVICKFEADNSTRRTILFKQSCHVCRNNTVPFIVVKINSHSEGEVASWNIKSMKINFKNILQNQFLISKLFLFSSAFDTNSGSLNNELLTLKYEMQRYNRCPI